MAQATTDFQALYLQASRAFTPAIPISSESLFAGRLDQVSRLVDAINQPGQHAVLFGERGVGKTSLANILSARWQGLGYIVAPRIGCVSTDTYETLWRNALREITYTVKERRAGFRDAALEKTLTMGAGLPERFNQGDVRDLVTKVGRNSVLVLTFDEFDTLNDRARKAMAETVKLFSDYSVPVTLIFVGVADSVAGLLKDHRSIERALIQVRMPRMTNEEVGEIINKGLAVLHMSAAADASERIVSLSRGLPHYTHLLGLHAVRAALLRESLSVGVEDVERAVDTALKDTQQSTIDAYITATSSSQRNHLFRQVLLACALAETNELGFFPAGAVSEPLSKIMGKKYEVPSYARHLNEFCSEKRGRILQRVGEERNYRFRFRNPLMQPYVVMQGFAKKMLSAAAVPEGKIS